MLPKVDEMQAKVEQRLNDINTEKNSKLSKIVKLSLEDIYKYPQTLKYSKLLSHNQINNYISGFKINDVEYSIVTDFIVKSINTNTDLYAYHNISGVIISWHPEWVIKKEGKDIDPRYALSLNIRIDVEELQLLSKTAIKKQVEIEKKNTEVYIANLVNVSILNATNDGKPECVIYGDDFKKFIKIEELNETRNKFTIAEEIHKYIYDKTDYYTHYESIRINHDYRYNYDMEVKLTIKWDKDSVQQKKDEQLSKIKQNDEDKESQTPVKSRGWLDRFIKIFQ